MPAYFETAERLDRDPVLGVDGALFRQVVFGGLYSPLSYGRTAQTWQSLRDGDAAAARTLLDEVSPLSNALSVFVASTCNDSEWPEDVRSYRRAVAEDREKFPMFGAASANILPCAYWSEPVEPPVQISDEGPHNVLILQNRRDPVTPLAGGQRLHEKFGDRSRLVTVDGSGHGVYALGDNACALNVGTAYLVEGKMPRHDVACPAG